VMFVLALSVLTGSRGAVLAIPLALLVGGDLIVAVAPWAAHISQYLLPDPDLTDGLHVLDGKDHTGEIRVEHLLGQTSGLPDNFEPLLERLVQSPDSGLTLREAVLWARKSRIPRFPGEGFHYTDTNYHLLGFLLEHATGLAFGDRLAPRAFHQRRWCIPGAYGEGARVR
jgi:hypothetical protein